MDGGFEDGRERARRIRHDDMYGILAGCDTDYDSDDDDNGNGSRRRKRRRDASDEPDLSKPVRFISAGSVMPSQNPGPGPVNATAKEDKAKAGTAEEVGIEPPLPAMFGKIRQGAQARREKKERERAAAARRAQASSAGMKPPPPAPGTVRSNAKVIEMMRNMRYVDGMGLGKDGQGITEPVPVTERHKNAGLGYDPGESTTQSVKENLPPPPTSTNDDRPPRWSKKARARKAPVLAKNALPARRAEQALEEEEEAEWHPAAVVQKVIDRRGRQERVLTDLRGLNDEQGQQMQADADDAPMPELRHNVRLLVDDTEATVVWLDGQLRREHEKAASLAREELKLSKQEAEQKRQLQIMETIAGALEQVRMDDSAGVLTLEGLLLTFRDLKARFAEEFKLCGMAWVACQFAHPLLVRFFQGWQPLEDPSVGLELMASWKDLLEGDGDFSHGAAASMAPYAQLVCEIIVPPVRMSGTNSWEARDPEPMLEFLKTWRQVPGTGENMAFLRGRGAEKLQVDAAEKASQFPSCHGTTEPDLSFKECIQAYAMEKGLLFMPRVGRFYHGMPVYEFGSVNICLDSVKRVIYAQIREGSERWSAVSLMQLVEMNWVGRTC